jgi:ABC-type lipoprotein release transport system permease subunit
MLDAASARSPKSERRVSAIERAHRLRRVVVVAGVFMGLSYLACRIPAQRAVLLDPSVLLRER